MRYERKMIGMHGRWSTEGSFRRRYHEISCAFSDFRGWEVSTGIARGHCNQGLVQQSVRNKVTTSSNNIFPNFLLGGQSYGWRSVFAGCRRKYVALVQHRHRNINKALLRRDKIFFTRQNPAQNDLIEPCSLSTLRS